MDGKSAACRSGERNHEIQSPHIRASGRRCGCSAALSRVARADTYPSRPARIVVGFTAGGAIDIQARLIGDWLSQRLGQQFIVENKPGAFGNIGTETVAKAPANGYTLLQIVTRHAINSAL